jgi:hypothetical protein
MVPKDLSMGDNLFICVPFYLLGFTCIATCIKRFFSTFSCLNQFSIGFNVGTFHRLFVLAGFFYLVYSDNWKYDSKEFGNGALRSGGVLTASSSWVPSYTVENSILREFIIKPKWTTDYNSTETYLNPNLQSSWCAGYNNTGEWIQVSLPKTQFWQGIKISGNPLLGAYVTDFLVELGTEDGSDEKMKSVLAFRDFDYTGIPNAKTILTYRFVGLDDLPPTRHLRISPQKWIGPRPCLRFEAYFY